MEYKRLEGLVSILLFSNSTSFRHQERNLIFEAEKRELLFWKVVADQLVASQAGLVVANKYTVRRLTRVP